MAVTEIENAFRLVLEATSSTLKGSGYTKRGASFRRKYGNNIAIADFQKSSESSADVLRFTINLGIVSAKILEKWDPEKDPAKQSIWDAHLRVRLGELVYGKDHWWVIASNETGAEVGEEVATLVETEAVPFLDKHHSDLALIALWKSGKSPGLTEGQRDRNLAMLDEVN